MHLVIIRLLALLLLLAVVGASAQQEMEVIPLQHRAVEQVLPALLPLVEAGGALSGMNNQLIIRASRRNRDEIRRALAAIDTPQRQLMIHVSQSRDAQSRQSGMQPGYSRNDGNAQVYGTRRTQDANSQQRVQVLEGGRAFILLGRSLPLTMRQVVIGARGAVINESTVYHDVGQGFYAEARLAGDRVTLEISPQGDTPGIMPGSVNTQRLSSTVSGRLGEWIELGGSGQASSRREYGATGLGTETLRESRSIWLRVEEVLPGGQ